MLRQGPSLQTLLTLAPPLQFLGFCALGGGWNPENWQTSTDIFGRSKWVDRVDRVDRVDQLVLWLVWLLRWILRSAWRPLYFAPLEGTHWLKPKPSAPQVTWETCRKYGWEIFGATVGSSQLEMIWSCSQMDASTFCSTVPFGGWWFSWLTAWSRCDKGLILPHLHRLNRCSQHFHLIFSKITGTFVEVVILLGRCFRWSSPWAKALPEGRVGVRAWGVQCLLILSNTNSFSWNQAAEARQIGHSLVEEAGSLRRELAVAVATAIAAKVDSIKAFISSPSQPETRFTTHLHFAYPTLDVPNSIWVCPNNRAYPDVAISTDQIMTIYVYIYNHL